MQHKDAVEDDERARAESLKSSFKEAFGAEPEFIARGPGRINLIGEHTDYNGGFVLPAAINRTVLIASRRVPGSTTAELISMDYGNRASFDLSNIVPAEGDTRWTNYVRAVAWAMSAKGMLDLAQLGGVQLAVQGNVPRASGLSSSAAIEVASGLAFARMAGAEVERKKLALTCQYAENEFIGVKSGIMDQFISALGQEDSALLVDTRSLDYRSVPLGLKEIGYALVAVDSAVPRSLITSAYNHRRAECEEAMKILAPLLHLGGDAQLRDVSLDQLEANAPALPDTLYRRARHVVSEDARTLEAVNLMEDGLGNGDNLARFGGLLYQSHRSLRDDYEVSSRELDMLVELASKVPGVAGARMTGAGFGGCTVNIVATERLGDFEQQVVEAYRQRSGLDGKMYVCNAVEGGSYIEV